MHLPFKRLKKAVAQKKPKVNLSAVVLQSKQAASGFKLM